MTNDASIGIRAATVFGDIVENYEVGIYKNTICVRGYSRIYNNNDLLPT